MIKDLLHTTATYGTAVGLTLTMAPVVSLVSVKDERLSDSWIRAWSRGVLRAAGVKPRVYGLEEVPTHPCVFVSNHQSHFDAPLLFLHLPGHVRFVGKAELFKIPVFGFGLKHAGFLEVDRTGGSRDRQVLAGSVSAVRERTSILFFAEGTRSDDGVLLPFKKGAAVLALDAQVPIVPLGVAGTRHILPKGSAWIRGGKPVVLRVGKPIPTEGLTLEDRAALTERAREAVRELVEQGEAELQGT